MYNRPAQSCSLGPQLVVPVLSDVPHPRKRLVPRLLDDLQISDLKMRVRISTIPFLHSVQYLYAGSGEIRYFKLDMNGRFSFIYIRHNTRQLNKYCLRIHQCSFVTIV